MRILFGGVDRMVKAFLFIVDKACHAKEGEFLFRTSVLFLFLLLFLNTYAGTEISISKEGKMDGNKA